MDAIQDALAAAVANAPGEIYVGFSGGLDSTVLLHAAARAVGSGRIAAVHVNHGLHADAEHWQRHCSELCAALEVRFVPRRVMVPDQGNREARARTARYRIFAEMLSCADSRLLLAHHHDDQVETVLLRLFQGRGLYGMPRARPLGGGLLLRPLLDVPRQVVAAYAASHELVWVEDPSNRDETLDRNFLRHRLLGVLRQRWPQLDRALLTATERHRLADELLLAHLGPPPRAGSLPLSALLERAPAERPELLRLWLAAEGIPAPARTALREFVRQLDVAGDRQPELALAGGCLRRFRDRVYLATREPALESRYPMTVPGVLRLPHGALRLVGDPAGCRPVGAVEVRFRRGGERLRCKDRHTSVKHLFQQAGVPPWLRGSYPLLYDAHGLLAVPGLAQRVDGDALSGEDDGWPCRAEWEPRVQLRGQPPVQPRSHLL